MAFQIKSPVGLAAKIAAANPSALATAQAPIKFLPVSATEIKDKLGILFDDSGSMRGQPLKEAKEGVIEFLRSCSPNQTAVGIYPLNGHDIKLDTNLPYLATLVQGISTSGSTPLVSKAIKILEVNKEINRLIAFSDGCPDSTFTDNLVALCKERKLPIDTFFIGSESDTNAMAFMKKFAEDTGGIFMHLKPGVSMRATLKYLAPAFRAMLTDGAFKAQVEGGKV
jgi:Mg-chelatase subunit ChlD